MSVSNPEPETQFCTACGAALDPDSRFCTECGAPVEEESSSSPPRSNTASASPAPAKQPASRRKLLLGGVVLLAILIGAFYWWNSNRHVAEEPTEMMTEGFPADFPRDIHRRFPTPAQLTYYYLLGEPVEEELSDYEILPPVLKEDEVEVTLRADGMSTTMSFIEFENDGRLARVMVGPADSEPDGIYVLRKGIFSRWKIIGIEPVFFPDPGEAP